MHRWSCTAMPQIYETHLKRVLITCAGFLAGSLGVFVSVLSVIVSPLLSRLFVPKPILIGEGQARVTSRLQLPPEKIRFRHPRQSSSDKSSSLSSNTSSNDTTHSVYSNLTAGHKSRRSPSPNGTRSRDDIYNASESALPSRPSTPGPTSAPSSPPKAPKNGLRTYLGMRKRSTILGEATTEEPSPMTGNAEIDLGEASHERKVDQAEIIVSPPTPSSSIFLHSAPGPSEARFQDVSTAGKPAARFVKSHSKRHSLTAACPRKRRSGKRSPNAPTPKSVSPTTSPVVESKWNIATRSSQRKKRKSLRIDPPLRSAAPSVLIESEDALNREIIYEEPIGIIRPHTAHLPVTPARQGPVRTRPYEAPYFFPTPGSPEAIGYVDRVREERRTTLIIPDPTTGKSKKDLKRRSSTMSSLEKDGTPGSTNPRGETGHNQTPEVLGKKRPKSAGKGSGTKNSDPSMSTLNEFGVQTRTQTILRKTSAPAQLSSSGTTSTPTTPPRSQTHRQGSLGIMRILGKH